MFKIHVHIRNPKKPQLPSEIHNEISIRLFPQNLKSRLNDDIYRI